MIANPSNKDRMTQTAAVVSPAPSAADEAKTGPLTAEIGAWLGGAANAAPAHIDTSKYANAVDYAKGRYAIGLGHYRAAFRDIGFAGKRHGLDVGSGAGHWTLAFALDNERAAAIDRNEEFAALANRAAAVAGLAGRVHHTVGAAEALPFPDAVFDAVWAHSLLMYCDTESALAEIARVLEPGGHFYCGYSSTGFRLHCIHVGARTADQDYLAAQLRNYLGSTLQRDGIAHAHWSNLRAADAAELTGACRAFGMSPVRSPGLQDGQKDFAGIPATIDLLCVGGDHGRRFRAELLELSAASGEGRRRYRELLRCGLGKLVQGVLDERGEALADPDIRALYVLAGIRAGRADRVADLARHGLDERTRGLLAFELRRMADAIAAFSALPADHPDRSFLLGAALLRAGRPEAAAKVFDRGAAAGQRPVDCQFGAMLARLPTADWPEQRRRMVRVLQLLPARFGAAPEKAAELAQALIGPRDRRARNVAGIAVRARSIGARLVRGWSGLARTVLVLACLAASARAADAIGGPDADTAATAAQTAREPGTTLQPAAPGTISVAAQRRYTASRE